jgi:putative flippase GtrA
VRWIRFSAVGIAGVAIQLSVLWLCTNAAHIAAAFSIVIAVETALLHNFAWHENWTWRELPASGRWGRLMRFHASNGFVSIASNTSLTLFFRHLGTPLLAANLMAIGLTALLNFALAEIWVFRRADIGAS